MKNKKEETKFKPGQITHIVFAALGIGVILGGSLMITPNFPIVVGSLLKLIEELKGIKIPKKKIKRVLKQLKKRDVINLEKRGGDVYVTIKDGNNVEILKYSLKEILELKKKKKWEKKWFVVVFDVPEEQRNKRNYLRSFLKEIGFYPYQQSVYIYPYECEKEINLLKKILEGGSYINYLVAEKLEREKELKIKFGIT